MPIFNKRLFGSEMHRSIENKLRIRQRLAGSNKPLDSIFSGINPT